MRVNRFCALNYRNLQNIDISPVPGVNVFFGRNAQGKTNLLEAIWLFTGARSFRGAKDAELIAFKKERAVLQLAFYAAKREQKAQITLSPRRTAELNGVALSSAGKLAGRFCGVVFSPAHLSLITDGPESRRRFVDAAYCQLRPSYIGALAAYNRVLAQRNALLRQIRGGAAEESLLAVYDTQLAAAGAGVARVRGAYLTHISPQAAAIYDGLSRGAETLAVTYQPSAGIDWQQPAPQAAAALHEAILTARGADLAAGFSTVGPHRDDFDVTINGQSARTYGSQGQKRSAVLALKLAEAQALREVIGEPPIALLDDVMSELDEYRQDYLLNHLTDGQVFVTCCEPSAVMRLAGGARFRVENGEVTRE